MRTISRMLMGLAVCSAFTPVFDSTSYAGEIKVSSGKCLDVHQPDMSTNGALVQIWTCLGTPNQDWSFDSVGRLINGGGKCLDVDTPKIGVDGGRIQVWDCHGEANQKWSINGLGEMRVNNSDKCLDVHAPEVGRDGGRVQLWTCSGQANQKWSYEPVIAPGLSNADAIRIWIDSLPHLDLVQPIGGTWGTLPNLPEGIDGQQRIGGLFVNDEAELAILKSYSNIMWPGALVQGASINNNNFAPILLARSRGRIRLDGSFVGDATDRFVDLPVIGAGEAASARERMLAQINARDVAGTSHVTFATAGTVREGMVKLGVTYKSAANSLSVNGSLNSSFNDNTVFAKYTQVFYKVAFDPDGSLDSPFFADSVTLNQVKRFTSPQNPPLFVSEVTFGRTLVLQVRARKSTTDLEAAVKAAFGPVSGSLEGTFKETLDSSTVEALSVGATGELSARTLASAMNAPNAVDAFRKYMTEGAIFGPTNPGAPIAFTMSYMGGSGSMGNRVFDPAIAQMVTAESPEIRLSAREFCREGDESIELWRGRPGGGWKDTGLTAKIGDKFRFIPDMDSRVRSLRVGEPAAGTSPLGWAQPIPGPFDFQFPIGNRPPFSLIGRIGDRNNIGKDITGGEQDSTSGTGDSDSFHIGGSKEITVGKKAYGSADPKRSYDNEGQVYLGINDSEAATLGFSTLPYHWRVKVCITPSIY